jgi:hypothetical protein
MTTRRDVLASGVAASITLTPGLAALATERTCGIATRRPRMELHKIAFDGRYAAGRVFGDEAKRMGGDVHDIDGDITPLWFNDLRIRWKHEPVAVAGLTTFSSFLSLKLMAMDAGIRPVYRGYHHLEKPIRHEMFGPESALPKPHELRALQQGWESAVARLVFTWPQEAAAPVNGEATTLALADERWLSGTSLTSWILAPVTVEAAPSGGTGTLRADPINAMLSQRERRGA